MGSVCRGRVDCGFGVGKVGCCGDCGGCSHKVGRGLWD